MVVDERWPRTPSSSGGGLGDVAGGGERRAAGRAAGVARADRRGRRRGAPADRAGPARRCATAPGRVADASRSGGREARPLECVRQPGVEVDEAIHSCAIWRTASIRVARAGGRRDGAAAVAPLRMPVRIAENGLARSRSRSRRPSYFRSSSACRTWRACRPARRSRSVVVGRRRHQFLVATAPGSTGERGTGSLTNLADQLAAWADLQIDSRPARDAHHRPRAHGVGRRLDSGPRGWWGRPEGNRRGRQAEGMG